MEIFVGIDPSINSTGICCLFYDDNTLLKEQFYIIKPNKLTKKEQKLEKELFNFDYILYNTINLDNYKTDNHKHEFFKTKNMIILVDKIFETILNLIPKNIQDFNNIYLTIEGISYGSSKRTKSVFDLSGLNYMIRYKIIKYPNIYLTIAPPTEIKKFTTGNGNCKKDMIVELFKSSHSEIILPKIDDIADAYYMAKFAREIYINNINEENINNGNVL